MRNLKIKYAAAYNFLPFGPEGIQLTFDNYKNVVLVRGENRDARQVDPSLPTDELRVSSNGTGKSSIQEIVVYALFGKTVKRPEKLGANDVVHNKVGKDARVEIVFDEYRALRTRKDGGSDKKNSLRLWHSPDGRWEKDTEITQGTMALTQKKIEEIIGLSYDAFVNICIFTDDQRACFLECENKQKKEIVENMLSLGMYREWHDNARAMRKDLKSKIDIKTREFEILKGNEDDAVRRLALTKEKEVKWRSDKKTEIEQINLKIDQLVNLLETTDSGQEIIAYDKAQQTIREINEKLPELEKLKSGFEQKLQAAKEKESQIKDEASKIQDSYREISGIINDLVSRRKSKDSELQKLNANVPGATCDKCMGEVQEENIKLYAGRIGSDIRLLNADIERFMAEGKRLGEQAKSLKEKQDKIKTIVDQKVTEIISVESDMRKLRDDLVKASQVREPKVDQQQSLIQQKIESFKQQASDKQAELLAKSPFADIIENDESELERCKSLASDKDIEVKGLESELPYFDYWITGFGDHGIRKWVVDGIIPELNNRINYWLQFLIDNRITLRFDNELNETIERNPADGDPYIYHAMSTGQRRRLNLAVSQSFAHVMSMSSGSLPSIVFLDEVTTNVDPLGVQGIYNMIMELAEDKQVFVTTHDHDLIRMLDGCDNIHMVLENGFTRLAS